MNTDSSVIILILIQGPVLLALNPQPLPPGDVMNADTANHSASVPMIPVTTTRCCNKTCPQGEHCETQNVVCIRAPCNPVENCVRNCPFNQQWVDCKGKGCKKDTYCNWPRPNCNPPGYCICNSGFYRTSNGNCTAFCPRLPLPPLPAEGTESN